MVLTLMVLLAAAPPGRPFAEERSLLDRRLETLRRILPDAANPSADAALVKGLAEEARLSQVDAQARPPVEAGAKGDVIVDLSALGRFAEIDRFFRQVAFSHRLIDVESLALTATPQDTVKLAAVLRLPYRPAKAPLPPPPDGTRARLAGVARATADAYVRDLALSVAKSEAIVALRRAQRNPRLFLSELSAATRDRPVVLTHASLGEEFLVRGLTVGEGPVRALATRFERGFFRLSDFLVARQSACHRFEARGRSPVAGPEAELPLPTEDPFQQDETPCRVDRDSERTFVLQSPTGRQPGKGPLTLRVREMDLADLFLVLHHLTSQGFILDASVTGRVSVDLNRVTLDGALSALQKAGVKVSPPGRLRRASLGHGATPPLAVPGEGSESTPVVNFTLKRAEVREILAVMTDLDPSLAALGPEGSLGRVSLWAKDMPLADLRAAILSVAGLSERTEEGRRILERNPGSGEPLVPVAGEVSNRKLVLRAHDLAVLEFELAGLAANGDEWLAFAYSPAGTLNVYRVGDRLADGSIKAIESTDIAIETDEGRWHVPLPPMPR